MSATLLRTRKFSSFHYHYSALDVFSECTLRLFTQHLSFTSPQTPLHNGEGLSDPSNELFLSKRRGMK